MNNNLLSAIGNTPMVEIQKLSPNPKVAIYAKLEWCNPSGSLKDRIAKYIIENAEARGELTPEQTIVEATSGNTGIALAMVGALKNYSVELVMPENMSVERRKIMTALGAKVTLTPAEDGSDAAIAYATELAKDRKYFLAGQFTNEDNVRAHYETTGAEILQQVPAVDVFIAGMGTGGAVTGIGKRLKEHDSHITVIGLEPTLDSNIQGLKNFSKGYVPPIIDFSLLDERIYVHEKDAIHVARELARREGLFVGLTSGAVMYAAMKQAQNMDEGNIVILFGDSGNKYLSTGLFD